MAPRPLCLIFYQAVGWLVLLTRSPASNAESLVLWHEVAVLRGRLARPWTKPPRHCQIVVTILSAARSRIGRQPWGVSTARASGVTTSGPAAIVVGQSASAVLNRRYAKGW
jgi:hypothetical protein